MFMFMTPARTVLGATRAIVGLGAWFAPDTAARLSGIDPERSDRFITRLFGARDLALAVAVLAAPPAGLRHAASIGVAIDAADVVAGFDERRRGNLSAHATAVGPVGALVLAVLGVIVAREATAAT